MMRRLTAMVVETNYLIASAIAMPLKAAGYEVAVAVNDEEVRDILAIQQLHVAIIDFRLQHGSPDGLVARLEAAKVPYIFCTAAGFEEVEEHFPGARVILKPWRDDTLLSVVEQAAKNRTHLSDGTGVRPERQGGNP